MIRRPSIVVIAAAVALAGAVPAGATLAHSSKHHKHHKAKTVKVKVRDNYYAKSKLKVKAGTKVTWTWPSSAGDTHDVKARKVPKHAKKFHSGAYASGAKYSQTLKKPGKYKLYCTFHRGMKMTITVTKKHKRH